MIPNTNPETRLPYGVISGKSLEPELSNELHIKALNVAEEACWDERREHYRKQANRNLDQVNDLDVDEWVETQVENELRDWSPEEPSAAIEHEGVKLHYSFLGGAPLIYSLDGPITHVEHYCSPCVPGAADLDSGFGEITCHGLPLDWYADKPVRYEASGGSDYWAVIDRMTCDCVVEELHEYEGQEGSSEQRAEDYAAFLNGEYVKKADVLALLGRRTWDNSIGVYTFSPRDIHALDRLLEN